MPKKKSANYNKQKKVEHWPKLHTDDKTEDINSD
jgi:hypothetical protein